MSHRIVEAASSIKEYGSKHKVAVAACLLILITLTIVGALLLGRFFSGQEISVTLGQVYVPGKGYFTVAAGQWGPYDPDGSDTYTVTVPYSIPATTTTAYGINTNKPDVLVSITDLRHCNENGSLTDKSKYVDTFSVVQTSANGTKVTYIYDLHYYRFSVIVKTQGDLTYYSVPTIGDVFVINYGECKFPSGWAFNGICDGRASEVYVYPEFLIVPWEYRVPIDASLGTEQGLWAGVLQADITKVQAGNLAQDLNGVVVGPYDKNLDSSTTYYSVGTKLDVVTDIAGTPLTQYNFHQLGPDSSIYNNVYLSKLYASILPGSYWKLTGAVPTWYDNNPEGQYTGKVINGVVVYEVQVQMAIAHKYVLHSGVGGTTTNETGGWTYLNLDQITPIIVLIVVGIIIVAVIIALSKFIPKYKAGKSG